MAKEIKEKNEKKKTNKRRRARRGKKKTHPITLHLDAKSGSLFLKIFLETEKTSTF